MTEFVVKILGVKNLTHDVKQFTIERPAGYNFIPGQATEVCINKAGWKDQKRPFTFTCLSDSDHLEFVIKIYPSHDGVTNELGKLITGDELIVHDVWGAIHYKSEGVFIAGGAGITPFIAILRDLDKKGSVKGNKLIFSNKTSEDIILEEEFDRMLGKNFSRVLTKQEKAGAHFGRIDKNYLKDQVKNFGQHFYVCGPENFTESIQTILTELGASAEAVVIEK
jgi:ferredoxin-NADP reductase